jgi:superfamily II DNA or RNA helicase
MINMTEIVHILHEYLKTEHTLAVHLGMTMLRAKNLGGFNEYYITSVLRRYELYKLMQSKSTREQRAIINTAHYQNIAVSDILQRELGIDFDWRNIYSFLPTGFDLRPSQIEFFSRFRKSTTGIKNGDEYVFSKTTGTGKTLLFLTLANILPLDRQIAFVVPTIELANQTIDRLLEYFPESSTQISYRYSNSKHARNPNIQYGVKGRFVIFVDKSYANFAKESPDQMPQFAVNILDESHRLRSPKFRQQFEKQKKYGITLAFTATPLPLTIDKRNQDDIPIPAGDTVQWMARRQNLYGKIVYQDDPVHLESDGELCPIEWDYINGDIDTGAVERKFLGTDGEYSDVCVIQMLQMSWSTIIESFCNKYIDSDELEKRKKLFFVCPNSADMTAEAARKISKNLNITTACVTSKYNFYTTRKSDGSLIEVRTTKDKILEKYRSGEITAICSIRQLREGLDIPEIDWIINLLLLNRVDNYLQYLGRGRRTVIGKDSLLVTDLIPDIGTTISPITAPQALGRIVRNSHQTITDNQESASDSVEPERRTRRHDANLEQYYEAFFRAFETPSEIFKRLRGERKLGANIHTGDIATACQLAVIDSLNSGKILEDLVKSTTKSDINRAHFSDLPTQIDYSEQIKQYKFNPRISYIDILPILEKLAKEKALRIQTETKNRKVGISQSPTQNLGRSRELAISVQTTDSQVERAETRRFKLDEKLTIESAAIMFGDLIRKYKIRAELDAYIDPILRRIDGCENSTRILLEIYTLFLVLNKQSSAKATTIFSKRNMNGWLDFVDSFGFLNWHGSNTSNDRKLFTSQLPRAINTDLAAALLFQARYLCARVFGIERDNFLKQTEKMVCESPLLNAVSERISSEISQIMSYEYVISTSQVAKVIFEYVDKKHSKIILLHKIQQDPQFNVAEIYGIVFPKMLLETIKKYIKQSGANNLPEELVNFLTENIHALKYLQRPEIIIIDPEVRAYVQTKIEELTHLTLLQSEIDFYHATQTYIRQQLPTFPLFNSRNDFILYVKSAVDSTFLKLMQDSPLSILYSPENRARLAEIAARFNLNIDDQSKQLLDSIKGTVAQHRSLEKDTPVQDIVATCIMRYEILCILTDYSLQLRNRSLVTRIFGYVKDSWDIMTLDAKIQTIASYITNIELVREVSQSNRRPTTSVLNTPAFSYTGASDELLDTDYLNEQIRSKVRSDVTRNIEDVYQEVRCEIDNELRETVNKRYLLVSKLQKGDSANFNQPLTVIVQRFYTTQKIRGKMIQGYFGIYIPDVNKFSFLKYWRGL